MGAGEEQNFCFNPALSSGQHTPEEFTPCISPLTAFKEAALAAGRTMMFITGSKQQQQPPLRLSQEPTSPCSAQGEPQTAIWPCLWCFNAGHRTLSSSPTPGVNSHETEKEPGHGFTAVKAINTNASLKSRRRMIFLVLKMTFCIISKCSDVFFCLTSTLMAQHQQASLPSQLLQDKY